MSNRPALQVRRPEFELDESLPRYWHGGDPFQTHFFDALSSLFPDGEAFFVRSVLHYRERVEDPALRSALVGFAGQEGQHSHQHDRHLALLEANGYRMIKRRNRLMARGLRMLNRWKPRYSLAATAALEHLTALLARQLMQHPERSTDPMDPRMAALWRWHAVEEAEHKSVAFDVLQIVAPGRALRFLAMIVTSTGLAAETLLGIAYMLYVDGRLFEAGQWSGGFRFLFGRAGMLRGTASEYRRWFRRDFHPDQVDDTFLIDATLGEVARASA